MTRLEMLELMLESKSGRRFGWFVERDGKRMAALSAPRFEDMFWVSYIISPLGETPEEGALVMQNTFWEPPGLTFSSRVSGAVAPHAFASMAGLNGDRVVMRGLYVPVPAPSVFERVRLRVRRLWRGISRGARRAHDLRRRAALGVIRRRSV